MNTKDKYDADKNEVSFDFEAAQAELGQDLFGVEVATEVEAAPETPPEEVKAEPANAEPAAEAVKSDTPAETPAAESQQEKEPTTATTATPSAAPETWRKEAKEEWDKLPATVQAEITKREQDMFRGIEGYRASATLGNNVKQFLEPHLHFFEQSRENPLQLLSNLTQAHVILSTAPPARRRELFLEVAKSYGVDILSEPAFVDPQVANLQNELYAVKSQMQSRVAAEQASAREQLRTQLDTFIADPKNTHVNEVLGDMAKLLQGGVASSLEDAYKKACQLSPTVQAKELARQQEAEVLKQRETAETRTAAARQATSANVRTKSKPASAATPVGTMDDTLQETLTAIRSRS